MTTMNESAELAIRRGGGATLHRNCSPAAHRPAAAPEGMVGDASAGQPRRCRPSISVIPRLGPGPERRLWQNRIDCGRNLLCRTLSGDDHALEARRTPMVVLLVGRIRVVSVHNFWAMFFQSGMRTSGGSQPLGGAPL
jgi:hypothetical protein